MTSAYKEIPCKWCAGTGWKHCRRREEYAYPHCDCPDAYDCIRDGVECEWECECCGGDGIQLQKMSPLEQLASAADE